MEKKQKYAVIIIASIFSSILIGFTSLASKDAIVQAIQLVAPVKFFGEVQLSALRAATSPQEQPLLVITGGSSMREAILSEAALDGYLERIRGHAQVRRGGHRLQPRARVLLRHGYEVSRRRTPSSQALVVEVEPRGLVGDGGECALHSRYGLGRGGDVGDGGGGLGGGGGASASQYSQRSDKSVV